MTASSSTRTDTPIQEIPQSIQVIPRQLIDQQGATTVSEVIQNVSSVQPANSLGIGNTDFAPLRIRGFPAEQWRDGFVNSYDAGDRDGLVNVERVEVLKGPSAILFGGGIGSPLGGVVNVISKLPKDEAFVQTGMRVGSYSYWNPWIDINQPLNDDRTVLFRVTGEYVGNRSFVDVLNSKRYNINPTLTLTNRQDTTLTIQGFVTRQQQQSYPGLPVYGTILGDFRIPTNSYLGPRNTPDSYSENSGVVVTLDHQFNDIWSANVRGRWSRTQFDQLTQNLFGGDATGAVPAIAPATWFLQNLELFQKQEELTINPTVKAKFVAGPTRNVFLIGADYSKIKDTGFMAGDNLGNTCYFMTFDPVACPPATVDLLNPYFGFPVTRPSPLSGIEYARYFDYRNQYVTKGAYTLGGAGLLDGYDATSHWAAISVLPIFGAKPRHDRIVVDRNRITGGGVTAGIDFGLFLVNLLRNRTYAEAVQLMAEYAPAPPFDAGSPDRAPAEVTRMIRDMFNDFLNDADEVGRSAFIRSRVL